MLCVGVLGEVCSLWVSGWNGVSSVRGVGHAEVARAEDFEAGAQFGGPGFFVEVDIGVGDIAEGGEPESVAVAVWGGYFDDTLGGNDDNGLFEGDEVRGEAFGEEDVAGCFEDELDGDCAG
jgi:hypothetical protein